MVEGFKHTEVGNIPNDWEVKPICEIADVNQNGGKSIPNEFVYIDLESVTKGNLVKKNTIKKANAPSRAQRIIVVNDILFQTVRPYQKNNLHFKEKGEYIASTGYAVIRSKIDSGYLYAQLHTDRFVNTVVDLCTGTSYPAINPNVLASIKIPLPVTKVEQTAIATALNDADALINQLEQLLTKKRNIKTGAMQELLKPKEGWEEKMLCQVARYRRGSFPQPYGLDKWYDDSDGFPFVQVYDVDNDMKLKAETKRRISKAAQRMSVFVKKGSILLTIQGSIGRISMTQYDAYVDRTLLLFESYIVPFNHYFFMLLVHVLFEQEKQNAPGGTIKTITKEALSSFKISYPKIEEQNRIAEILSDMDNEIQELERELEKYKMLKQGMMQSLLTGKIRLI